MSYTINLFKIGPKIFTKELHLGVELIVPSGAIVKNPDGSETDEFKMAAEGVHVSLDFNVEDGDLSNKTKVVRIGHLTPVTAAGSAHKTTVNLKVNGATKDNKTKTQAQYEANPTFDEDSIKQ
jgi:hypothetical protein